MKQAATCRAIACLSLLSLMLLPVPAVAESTWAMVLSDSRLSFEASYDETPFEGHFQEFHVALAFDPAAPEVAQLTARVDVRSVDTANRDRDEALAGAEWFDFDRFPQAVYETDGFTVLPDGRFRSNGQLAMKGVTAPVPIEFEWRREGQGAVLDGIAILSGAANVNRMAFGVGTGEWSDDSLIGHWVKVHFHVVFEPVTEP